MVLLTKVHTLKMIPGPGHDSRTGYYNKSGTVESLHLTGFEFESGQTGVAGVRGVSLTPRGRRKVWETGRKSSVPEIRRRR